MRFQTLPPLAAERAASRSSSVAFVVERFRGCLGLLLDRRNLGERSRQLFLAYFFAPLGRRDGLLLVRNSALQLRAARPPIAVSKISRRSENAPQHESEHAQHM
jgi:hypothetical protein